MDLMADELAESMGRAVLDARKRIKKPLQALVVWRDAYESFLPRELLLYWTKAGKPLGHDAADLILPAPVVETTVPFSTFEYDDQGDKILKAFARRHKLKGLDWHGQITAPATMTPSRGADGRRRTRTQGGGGRMRTRGRTRTGTGCGWTHQ